MIRERPDTHNGTKRGAWNRGLPALGKRPRSRTCLTEQTSAQREKGSEMKAIRVEQVGGPEVLKLEDIAPIEEPGPGQAVVRVVAAGVNFMDINQRRGSNPRQVPFTPCSERTG